MKNYLLLQYLAIITLFEQGYEYLHSSPLFDSTWHVRVTLTLGDSFYYHDINLLTSKASIGDVENHVKDVHQTLLRVQQAVWEHWS